MPKVLVVYGGTSTERDVSLRSGQAVADALQKSQYDVSLFDLTSDLSSLDSRLNDIDIVFPALHGSIGEDGAIQLYLRKHEMPFVGSDFEASKLCFDKWHYKELLASYKILTPVGDVVNSQNVWQHSLTSAPFVLKPRDGGSSIDTYIVREPTAVDRSAIQKSLDHNSSMLLEQLIVGIEATVAIVDNDALPVIEIIPPENQEFDYANKYNGATTELCPPSNIALHIQVTMKQLALHIHRLTGCQDLSRTDMIVTSDDQIFVLETNTMPGLTNQSLLPKAALTAGITMPQLVDQLVTDALKRVN